MSRHGTGLAAAMLAFVAAAAFAGGPLAVDVDGQPVGWSTATPVPYAVDQGGLGSLDSPSAVALVDREFFFWMQVPTTSIRYVRAWPLPVDVTAANFGPYMGPYGGGTTPLGQNAIVFDADGSLFDTLFGVGSSIVGFAGPTFFSNGASTVPVGDPIPAGSQIVEGMVFLNGRYIDGVNSGNNGELGITNFSGAVLHELGHFSGLDHSQASGELFSPDSGLPGWNEPFPTMFPIIRWGQDSLGRDDEAAISTLYPNGAFVARTGCVAGTVYDALGRPVAGANVVARSPTNPDEQVSAVTGLDPLAPGSYRICGLIAGGQEYRFDVESIDGNFRGGSSVGPFDPPRPLPGPPESWSGARESADQTLDPPTDVEYLQLLPGQTMSGIDVHLGRQAFAVRNFTTDAPGTMTFATADFDGDGVLDFVASANGFVPGNRLLFHRGLGGGTFAAPQIVELFNGIDGLAAGQFNSGVDSDADVVAMSDTLNEVRFYAGHGDGTFAPATTLLALGAGEFFHGVFAAGDFNGDHSPDVVLAIDHVDGTATVHTLLGSPSGAFTHLTSTFAAGTFAPFSGNSGRAVGNFAGTAALDLAYTPSDALGPVSNPSLLGLLVGDGAGHFTSAMNDLSPQFQWMGAALASADFNQDGVTDLGAVIGLIPGEPVNYASMELGILLGDGAGHFHLASRTRLPHKTSGTLVAADFDRDGHADVMAIAVSTGTSSPGERVALALGDGHGGVSRRLDTWGLEPWPWANPLGAVTGDFDGDGRLDVLVSDSNVSGANPAYLSLLLQRDFLAPAPGTDFHTLTPCRLADTRLGGARLRSGREALVQVTGACAIPPGARAISLNITVVAPSAPGYLVVYPGDSGVPLTTTVNFGSQQTRATNAVLALARDGSGTLRLSCGIAGGGDTDWVIDVNGYFE